MELLVRGNKQRTQEPTAANQTSSRSHAVLQVGVRQQSRSRDVLQEVRFARLFMIDLAGSERAAQVRLGMCVFFGVRVFFCVCVFVCLCVCLCGWEWPWFLFVCLFVCGCECECVCLLECTCEFECICVYECKCV